MPPDKLRDIAKQLLAELDSGWLEVCKVPSQHGGYIRVPCSTNTEWYQRFCRKFKARRRRYPKPRTIIKRYLVRNALEQIRLGEHQGVYIERLIAFMESWTEC